MDPDDALFGNDESSIRAEQDMRSRIADWQVAEIRRRLDALGLDSMDVRQSAVEQVVGRSLGSLRDLSPSEGTVVLEGLAAAPSMGSNTSAWDARTESTWIDRL